MHSPRRTAASAAPHRTLPRTLATGLLTLSAVVGMSGCAAGTDPEPVRTSSPVHPSPSPSSKPSTPSPSRTADPDRWIDLEQELPTGDLDPQSRQTYEGEPRRLDDVHHQDCLDAFADGQQIPEREGEPDQGVSPWTAAETTVVPEGWKLCSPGALSSFAVPAHFTPEVEMGKGDRVYIRVPDGNGRLIGGLKDVGAATWRRVRGPGSGRSAADVADQRQPDRLGGRQHARCHDTLVDAAHAAGSKDNITAIVVRVDRRA